MVRPDKSIYLTEVEPAPRLAVLNELDSISYLERLKIDSSTVNSPPSLELLSTILLQHQLTIPFDSSSIHVKDWTAPSHPIELSKGNGMPLGEESFKRIILKKIGGGYCYAMNGLLASLLRGFGYKVAELGARVHMYRGSDPVETGYLWSAVTHETLLVDWEESEGSYLVDVGFGGGGCMYPILLKSGQTSPGLSPTESFLLVAETIPGASPETFSHHLPGWTLYRRVMPPNTKVVDHKTVGEEGEGYWTPCYFFLVSTLSIADIKIANWFNSTCPDSMWTNFLAVSTLIPTGARQTLAGPMVRPSDQKKMGKYWIKEGIKVIEEEVEWVEFESGPMGEVLKRKFAFNI